MRSLDVFFAVMVAVLWGGNFVAAKFGVAYFPPFFLTALRFVCVSLLLVPLVPRPSTAQLRRIFLISTMSTLHFSLIFVSLSQGLDIASCALIGQLGVPFACLLGAFFLGDKLGWWRLSGIVIAFAGTVVVAGTPGILSHMNAFYNALGSTLAWGAANVLIKRVQGIHSMSLLAWTGVGNIPLLLALSYIFEYHDWPSLTSVPLSALLGVSYTIIGSTLCAYGLWYYLLSRYTVSQVTPFSLLTPIFGIAAGQLFFTETLTLQLWLGGIITIIGVSVIVMRRPKTILLGEAT